MTALYDFDVQNAEGICVKFGSLIEGKVALVVNVASECGYTTQYKGLVDLQTRFGDDFQVIAFPCNQFLGQEPKEIGEVVACAMRKFKTNFPIMNKCDVNGAKAIPLYTHMKAERPGIMGTKSIKWNFTKFLIDHTGKVVKRFSPGKKPENIVGEIEDLIRVKNQ